MPNVTMIDNTTARIVGVKYLQNGGKTLVSVRVLPGRSTLPDDVIGELDAVAFFQQCLTDGTLRLSGAPKPGEELPASMVLSRMRVTPPRT